MRLATSFLIAIILALGTGWFLGASGKSAIEQQRRLLEERADLSEARALVVDGRVSLFQSNFGDASKRFQSASVVIEQVQRRLRETGQAERAGQLEIALAQLKDAGRRAIALDPTAQSAAEQALQAIGSVQK